MSLGISVLGNPGHDNAAFVRVDTGQSLSRLLFDCGEGCVQALPDGEAIATDHLFFSHFHMDHVAGFDAFFRRTFDRTIKPNRVWGPPGTAEILHHRLRGFTWNLFAGLTATWYAHEIHAGCVQTTRFDLGEAFDVPHPLADVPSPDGAILDGDGYRVEAYAMDHGIPSIAYVVREPARTNVDPDKLAALGLPPGSWLKRVRGAPAAVGEVVTAGGRSLDLATLQRSLLTTTPGESVAYATDLRLNESARAFLAQKLEGVGTLVCESQYRAADVELAEKNRHSTSVEAADLAARAGVGRLILFHLTERYQPHEWAALLAEARAVFPRTTFPDHWHIPDTVL